MSIKSGLPIGPIAVTTGDTTIFDLSAVVGVDRYRIEAMSAHNTTGASVSVLFYYSPDTTSASGDEIANVSISANDTVDINAIIGQGRLDNIIAVGSAVGVNVTATYVAFSGDD